MSLDKETELAVLREDVKKAERLRRIAQDIQEREKYLTEELEKKRRLRELILDREKDKLRNRTMGIKVKEDELGEYSNSY